MSRRVPIRPVERKRCQACGLEFTQPNASRRFACSSTCGERLRQMHGITRRKQVLR